MKFVAHRGESEAAPENTLESFTLAWLRGAVCIEGDFHLTKDGAVVCMHDDNARRTCGIDRPLAEMTLAELKALDAGSWKSAAWRFTRVPLLAEVLRTMPPYGEIFIELKSVGPILDRLPEIFAESKRAPEQLTFIAFDRETVATVKKRFPAHKAYFLTGSVNADGTPRFTPEGLVAELKALGADGVDMEHSHVTRSHVEALHDAGLTFHVWTADDAAEAARLIGIGVDSITTNRAYALRCELAQRGNRR